MSASCISYWSEEGREMYISVHIPGIRRGSDSFVAYCRDRQLIRIWRLKVWSMRRFVWSAPPTFKGSVDS